MHPEIQQVLRNYIHALYQGDFDAVYDLMHEDDVIEHKQVMEHFAEQMDLFGETEGFLRAMRIKDIATLKAQTPREFVVSMLGMMTRKIGPEALKKIVEGAEVTGVDHTELMAIVHYTMPVEGYDGWESMQSEVSMIRSGDDWKLLFKSGLQQHLQRFQKEIDAYHDRKSRDQPDKMGHAGDLTRYTLVGYKNLEGEVVFEARFKEAGDFSEGLAPVKVMKKWGYIDTTGELAIKPQFAEVEGFSERLAGVRPQEREGYGFINKSGKVAIAPKYDEVSEFSEGRCAVERNGLWGYIDTQGELITPLKFSTAGDYSNGRVWVSLPGADADEDFELDRDGNILDA